MTSANGRCAVAVATDGHPGSMVQQCAYELQHCRALQYACQDFVARSGSSAIAIAQQPQLQGTSCSSAAEQQMEHSTAAGGVAAGTAEFGTCTMLDAHEVSAAELASNAQHPAAYRPLQCLSRLPNPLAAEFFPASTRPSKASRRRRRRTRRNCATHTASLQTLDVLNAQARRLVSSSAEQALALRQPADFTADQLQTLCLPALARKRGGAHARRLDLRERKRAVAPKLQAAARRWLARRLAARMLAGRQRAVNMREQQQSRGRAAQQFEMLRAAGPCPVFHAPVSEWAQKTWAWLRRAGLGAAFAGQTANQPYASLTRGVQQVCRSLACELQHALGHFSADVAKVVNERYGKGECMHGGRVFHAACGTISGYYDQIWSTVGKKIRWDAYELPEMRLFFGGGRGRGRQVPQPAAR
mmetsp:Transcript_61055/g.101513  ORF Transcript_61055/g.101513 Transcript_61055/m.101513 type:complete len:415 (+) Transcript_61055:185-1429(+)